MKSKRGTGKGLGGKESETHGEKNAERRGNLQGGKKKCD